MKNVNFRFKSHTLFFILAATLSFFAKADDIDIYRSGSFMAYAPDLTTGMVVPPNPNYPNILFVLDASESMKRHDPGQTGSRLERLRLAMQTVLTQAEGVNIGLMRYSHKQSGGRVLYPMSPIEYAREEAIHLINTMPIDWHTPTIGAMLEAAFYYRGDPVYYGRTRTTHVGDFRHKREHLVRLSHPDSYTGGSIVREPECSPDNLDHASCITESIDDDPVYVSPIVSECQQNYIVVLSDGATSGGADVEAVENLTGATCSANGGSCGVKIAEFLANNDQAVAGAGEDNEFNPVITHTVGFNTNTATLIDFAMAGEGDYYQSNSVSDLVEAMSEIIGGANATAATLSQPAIAIDPTSLFEHRKDIYLTLFKPSLKPVWQGNLKGYWYDGALKDYSDPRKAAIDPATGMIETGAKSRWSATADGAQVDLGGAASKIAPGYRRHVVTNQPGGSALLLDPANEVNVFNLNAGDLGLPDANLGLTGDDFNSLVDWVRGEDVLDFNDNGDVAEERRQYADPLHSNPTTITYGRGENGEFDSVVVFGTNEGFLHAIDTANGEDLFSFIPWGLRENLKHSYRNRPFAPKLYGMDGIISKWFHDADRNGYVDSDADHYYLYSGMRRGGKGYVALDLSSKSAPEFMWEITGGVTPGFDELGQTWSKMVRTRIKHPDTGDETDVLVFGGGYDDSRDGVLVGANDTVGRAIYIVDAEKGDLIWQAGQSTDADLVLSDMNYSIPATPVVLDLDGDGLMDQMYVGDLGGQVWRFDALDNGTIGGGVLAALSVQTTGEKVFYSSPDISIVRAENGDVKLALAIGSGSRPEPMDRSQKNAFYVIMQDDIYTVPKGYGIKKESGDYRSISEDDLVDLTDNKIVEGTLKEISDLKQELAEKSGWYINMEGSGEKILNASTTIDNKVVFTSYVPGDAMHCSGGLGSSNLYVLDILYATPALDEEHQTRSHRKSELATQGISPPISALFPDKDSTVELVTGTEKALEVEIELMQRMYWSEEPEF